MSDKSKADFDAVWSLVRKSIKESGELSDQALDLWFSDIKLRELTSEKALFTVSSEFKYNTIVKRYSETVERHLVAVIGYEPEVEIIFDDSDYVPPKLEGEGIVLSPLDLIDRKKKNETSHETTSADDNYSAEEYEDYPEEDDAADPDKENAGEDSPSYQTTSASGKEKLTFNPDYTFENFVVGISNNFAYAFAKSVAEKPAEQYNPFYIYGPSGVGKTHLMYAITNRALELHPGIKITFVKGEDFTNQLIESISDKRTATFREKYRNVDMLLIDDVHFIAGRNTSQEEFFHTFNSLFEDHKQIILSSDRPPSEMSKLETRIRTRFESGLIADMQSPDFDLRVAILRRKAESTGIHLSSQVEDFLAERLSDNVRQIEGVIKKLSARYYLTGEVPSIEAIKTLIPEYFREIQRESPKIFAERVITSAAVAFDVDEDDIKGPKRDKNIRLARNVAMYIIKKNTDLSLSEVGDFFNRNHATVYSNCTSIESLLTSDPRFAARLREIENDCKN